MAGRPSSQLTNSIPGRLNDRLLYGIADHSKRIMVTVFCLRQHTECSFGHRKRVRRTVPSPQIRKVFYLLFLIDRRLLAQFRRREEGVERCRRQEAVDGELRGIRQYVVANCRKQIHFFIPWSQSYHQRLTIINLSNDRGEAIDFILVAFED